MSVTALATVDLVLLLLAAALGLASLRAWARHRASGFPVAKISAHLTLQIISVGIWAAFAITGELPIAWVAFAVITVGQVFGDLLMFASYRARHPAAAGSNYRAVSGDVLSFRRPVPALHALTGALAWFGMLGICLLATAGA
ncbi:MAG: hypothetical protein QM714_13335 [Nocardioides sp.]|uniref:hypothetical protein n=1 Tax=Nocardioides sp. TaxID=35761 RepID=UPI0039E4A0D6